jgi:hypothetical protein
VTSAAADPASRRIGLPPELQEFLATPQTGSLLIGGLVGSGRTRLALALLELSRGERIWVTGALPRSGESTPRVELTSVGGTRVLTYAEFVAEDASPSSSRIARARAPSAHPSTDVQRGAPGESDPGASHAARPGTGQTIVIDDWHSFVEERHAGRPSLEQHRAVSAGEERNLLRGLLGSSRKLILCVTNADQEAVGEIVDASCRLEREVVNDRVERWLELTMLLGHTKVEPFYPFTLGSGGFRSFTRFPSEDAIKGGTRAEPDPEPKEGMMWPGSVAFANAFGRLPVFSTSLIEIDPEVPYEVYYMIALPFLVSTFRARGRVSVVLPPLLRPDSLYRALVAGMSPERLSEVRRDLVQQVRFLTHLDQVATDPDFAKTVFPLSRPASKTPLIAAEGDVPRSDYPDRSAGSLRPRFPALLEWIDENPAGTPNGLFMSIDGMVAAAREIGADYTPESFNAIVQQSQSRYPMHMMMICQMDEPLVSRLKPLAAIRLRLLARRGHYFLQGVRPWTANYFLLPRGAPKTPSDPPYELVLVT